MLFNVSSKEKKRKCEGKFVYWLQWTCDLVLSCGIHLRNSQVLKYLKVVFFFSFLLRIVFARIVVFRFAHGFCENIWSQFYTDVFMNNLNKAKNEREWNKYTTPHNIFNVMAFRYIVLLEQKGEIHWFFHRSLCNENNSLNCWARFSNIEEIVSFPYSKSAITRQTNEKNNSSAMKSEENI